ncbi:MAG TPA: TonB-dependent receptor [Pyrinomonadaceae bacterium]
MTHNLKVRLGSLLLLFACCLGSTVGAHAQETSATISGRVTDQNGAAVTGAQVVITDTERGFQRTFQTNDEGVYNAPQLPVGTYTVTVENPGFKKSVQENIKLSVNDRRPLDITLEPGQVTETVNVTAEAPLIQESPTQQGLVEGKQVRELPLNNRNFIQLATLSAGVTSSLPSQVGFGGLSVVALSINGGRTSAVNYLVDGARNVDTGSNLTLLTVPSVDAIAEFTILTSNYAPEFGRNGGGVINVVTRSGTNDFHGTLYEFVRNDRLNAREPFRTSPIVGLNKSNGEPRFVPPLKYNDYGYTIGGPLHLPRFGEGGPAVYSGRDRTFFFFSQEFRAIRATSTAIGTVPTLAERNGIFTSRIADPRSGLPCTVADQRGCFPNNTIPRERFDPNAVALLNFIPPPNEALGGIFNRFRRGTGVAADFRQEILRIDHNFNDKYSISGRYIHDDFTRGDPGGNPFLDPFVIGSAAGTLYPNVAAQQTSTPGENLVISLKMLPAPTVINELAFDYAYNKIASTFVGTGLRVNAPGFTAPELFPGNLQGALPSITFAGATANLGFTSPQSIENPSYTIRDNLSIVRGNHVYKFGAFLSREAKNENAGNALNGSYAFSSTRTGGTGNEIANLLLGLPTSYLEDQNEVRVQLRYNTYEFYAQDTWKITPRFTLDYGARYSIFQNPVDENDFLTAFFPSRYDPARAVSIDPVSGNVDTTKGGDRFNGIVFANENSPYGRRVQSNKYNTLGPRVGFAYNVFGDGRTVLRGGFGVYYDRTLVGIVEQNAFVNPRINTRVTIDNPTLANPASGTTRTTVPTLTLQSTSDPFEIPRTYQYSLGLQRELFSNALLEVAYVGTSGRNLLRLVNINQPLPGARDALTAQLRANGTLSATQFASLNAVRPYKGFAAINDRRTEASSNYNSLQTTFNKRFSRGLQFGAVYTFSKNITDASTDRSDAPQDPNNLRLDRAVSQFDRTHVFTTNFVYELPFFRGRTDFAGTVLGGFQISGIYSAQSGTPLTITQVITGVNPTAFNDPLGTGSTLRPNLVGNPEGDRTVTRYFNTNAFAAAFGTFGSAGRGIVRGPGINNFDFTVQKLFRFKESMNLQLRAEFFNLFNHPQYGNPGTTVTFEPDPTVTVPAGSLPTVFRQTAASAATFGVISTTRDPRIIQFGVKFNF